MVPGNAWSDSTRQYQLADGYTAECADAMDFWVHATIYRMENPRFEPDWASRVSMADRPGIGQMCFWLKKGGQRIGGAMLRPSLIAFPFIESPFTDFFQLARQVTCLVRGWSDPKADVNAVEILPSQVASFYRPASSCTTWSAA